MNAVINIRVPYNAGNPMTSSVTIRFPGRTLLDEVGLY